MDKVIILGAMDAGCDIREILARALPADFCLKELDKYVSMITGSDGRIASSLNTERGQASELGRKCKTGLVSNGLNLLDVCDADQLAELFVQLMRGYDGERSRILHERTRRFVVALVGQLVYMRDKQGLKLDIVVIRNYINNLEDLDYLARRKDLTRIPDFEKALQAIGWDPDKPIDQQSWEFYGVMGYAKVCLVNGIDFLERLGVKKVA